MTAESDYITKVSAWSRKDLLRLTRRAGFTAHRFATNEDLARLLWQAVGKLRHGAKENAMKTSRAVTFHGAFSTKADAARKEHRVSGGYIRPTMIRGHRRFLVLARRTRSNPREHRPRVRIHRHTGRTFTLGKHSPWKGRMHRVNPARHHTSSGMSWVWLGVIAGGLWLLSRRPAEAVGPLPGVDWAPGPSGLE